MPTFSLLTGSLDDIVFEGRNQAYGAFQLRQSYQRHLGSALAITVTACTLLLLLPLAVHYFFPEVVVAPPVVPDLPQPKPQIYDMPRLKPALPRAAAQPALTVRPHSEFKTHVVADAAVQPTVETALPPDNGKAGPPATGVESTTGASTGTTAATVPSTDSSRPAATAPAAPLVFAEVMPDFVGGRSALQRYLQKHLHFPAAALAAQISGRVFVTFVVQPDGSISDVTVLKGLGYGTDEAAARVVREMPAWTPGMQNHRSVPVRFTLPITFQYE